MRNPLAKISAGVLSIGIVGKMPPCVCWSFGAVSEATWECRTSQKLRHDPTSFSQTHDQLCLFAAEELWGDGSEFYFQIPKQKERHHTPVTSRKGWALWINQNPPRFLPPSECQWMFGCQGLTPSACPCRSCSLWLTAASCTGWPPSPRTPCASSSSRPWGPWHPWWLSRWACS